MVKQIFATSTGRASHKTAALASVPGVGGAGRALIGGLLAQSLANSLESINLPNLIEPKTSGVAASHPRYALRIGHAHPDAKFVGHSGGCKGTPTVPFHQARVWARKQDAEQYIKHPNVRNYRRLLELVEVICTVGNPVYSEKPER